MPERKYAFQRVAPGLVLQPGNDGETMFAIGRYSDGPSFGLEDEPRDFTAWGWGRIPPNSLERIRALAQHDPGRAVDELDGWATDIRFPRHRTMRDAIAAALASGDHNAARENDDA